MDEHITRQLSIKVKRVYAAPEGSDGYRVLVDRLWPRGIKKADLPLDQWNKQLAPSTQIRKAFGHRPEKFAQFRQDYRAELSQNRAVGDFLEGVLRSNACCLTLLIAAKDPKCNHGLVLKEYLLEYLAQRQH